MLRVVVDGAPMADAEARAFWGKFSAYLDAHKGDLAGFAEGEGFASVHPETHGGDPVLVVSRTAPQRPYVNAAQRPPAGQASGSSNAGAGGSRAPQRGPRGPQRGGAPAPRGGKPGRKRG